MKTPTIKEIASLLSSLKKYIGDDYRVEFQDDDTPTMQVTVGCDDKGNWNYQTGDNSFTGGAYGLPYWAVCYLTPRSNCTELAREIVNELADAQAY